VGEIHFDSKGVISATRRPMKLLISLLGVASIFACFLGLAGLAERAWRLRREKSTRCLPDHDIAKDADGHSVK